MKTGLTLSILILWCSIVFCRNSSVVDSLQPIQLTVKPSTTLQPLIINGKPWVAMPKERLGRIANALDSLERRANLAAHLDSARTKCNEMVLGLENENQDLEKLAQGYEKEIYDQGQKFALKEKILTECEAGLEFLQLENKRLRNRNKWFMAGGITLVGVLAGALLLIAL